MNDTRIISTCKRCMNKCGVYITSSRSRYNITVTTLAFSAWGTTSKDHSTHQWSHLCWKMPKRQSMLNACKSWGRYPLPFGLQSAPLIFTALAYMQQRGISPVDHYLDDFIIPGSTVFYARSMQSSRKIINLVTKLASLGIEIDDTIDPQTN